MRSRSITAARRLGPPRSGAVLALVAIVAGALLAGCTGDMATRGEALRLVGQDLPTAVLLEPYEGQLHAVGGLRPYTFTLVGGALPDGLTLENGVLRGIATEAGSFAMTIEVSDANLSRVSQEYTLQVGAPPPPRFALVAPQTEVRGPVTLRARLEDARLTTAVRALVTWDPDRFELEGEPKASRRNVALLWRSGPGELQVDLAALGATLGGDVELFGFTLTPRTAPDTVALRYEVEVMTGSGDPARRHEYLAGSVGRPQVQEGGIGSPTTEQPPSEPPPAEDGHSQDGDGSTDL